MMSHEHKHVVEGYRKQCDGNWIALADDDNARQHLCAHLYRAGQFSELFELVTGSQYWAEARQQSEGNYAGFLSDLEFAWQWAESEMGWDLGRQLRCLLIESSIHALEEGPQIDDARDRVMIGRWFIRRWPNEYGVATLSMATSIQDDTDRAHELMSLMVHLTDTLKQQALAQLLAVQDEPLRLRVLCMGAHDLPDTLRVQLITPEFLSLIASQDEATQAFALDWLTRVLPEDLKLQAVQIARAIPDNTLRARILSTLAPIVDTPTRLPIIRNVFAALQSIESEEDRFGLFIELLDEPARRWQVEWQPEALSTALAFRDEKIRLLALGIILPELELALALQAAQTALESARYVSDALSRASGLHYILAHAPVAFHTELLSQISMALEDVKDDDRRCQRLIALIAIVPDDQKADISAEAMAAARQILDLRFRVLRMAEIASKVPKHQEQILQEALTIALEISEDWAKANAIHGLVNFLPEVLKEQALKSALKAIERIEDSWSRKLRVTEVASQLPIQLMPKAIQVIRGITNEQHQAGALSEFVRYLPDELLQQVELIADDYKDHEARTYLVTAVSMKAPLALKPVAFKKALMLILAIPPEAKFVNRVGFLRWILTEWEKLKFDGFSQMELSQIFHLLGRQPRNEILDELATLLKSIEFFGGRKTLAALFAGLQDVGQWWP